jgi:hypothetical protein
MKIEVVPHAEIRPLLREWRRSLAGTRDEQRHQAKELWNEFVRSIVTAKGPPPKSIPDNRTDPPTHWCDFPGLGMAHIVVEPDRRVGLLTYVRRIVVINLNFSPGVRRTPHDPRLGDADTEPL